jgi:transcriptional regulator with XRE-family HTH domain
VPQFNANAAIGQALRAIREEKGLSRSAVAKSLDVDQMTVYRWENGTRSPSPETLCHLAATYDTTFTSLVSGVEPAIEEARRALRAQREEG